jgi:hypothetical protein
MAGAGLTQQQLLAMLHLHSLLLPTTAWRGLGPHSRISGPAARPPDSAGGFRATSPDPSGQRGHRPHLAFAGWPGCRRPHGCHPDTGSRLQRGPELQRFLTSLLQQVQQSGDTDLRSLIPARYLAGSPHPHPRRFARA